MANVLINPECDRLVENGGEPIWVRRQGLCYTYNFRATSQNKSKIYADRAGKISGLELTLKLEGNMNLQQRYIIMSNRAVICCT